MKMNVYADKYAQNTRKGDMKKKTEPLVCVITGVWYLYGGFVISHWDDQGLVFIRRVRYKSLG